MIKCIQCYDLRPGGRCEWCPAKGLGYKLRSKWEKEGDITMSTSENLGRRLVELKEELEAQKQQRSELQGELRSLMNQLKEEFNVDTLEEAEKLLEEETEALAKLGETLRKKVEELEEAMGSA